jgi:hypothetical protein
MVFHKAEAMAMAWHGVGRVVPQNICNIYVLKLKVKGVRLELN